MDIRNFPVGRVKPLRGKFGIPIPGGVQGTPGGGTGDKGEDGTHSVILQLFPDLNNPNIWDKSPHYPLSPPASISEGGFTSPAPNQPHTPQNHHFNAFFSSLNTQNPGILVACAAAALSGCWRGVVCAELHFYPYLFMQGRGALLSMRMLLHLHPPSFPTTQLIRVIFIPQLYFFYLFLS